MDTTNVGVADPSQQNPFAYDNGYSTSPYGPTSYSGSIYNNPYGSITQAPSEQFSTSPTYGADTALPGYLQPGGVSAGLGMIPSVPAAGGFTAGGAFPTSLEGLSSLQSYGNNAGLAGGSSPLSAPPSPLNSSAGGIPWSTIFNNDLGNQQLAQQQQWLNYQMNSWLPAQLQMQQQAAAVQNALAAAQATGDYQGQQTLQAQLQQINANLANYQANMQGMIAQSGLSGNYNGSPTLQAQQLMNQYAALGGNQNLSARGQDLSYDQALMNFATQQGQLQEQLATSPLVAWYTARGLPPPTSAFMGQGGGSGGTAGQSTMPTFMQLYNSIPQFQGLGQFQAPNYSWNFPTSQSPVPYLPTNLTSGNGSAPNVTAP